MLTVGAFVINQQIIFRSYVKSSYGGWIGYGPCIVKDMNSQKEDIGQAVVEALNESKMESDLEKPITKEESTKQFKKYQKIVNVSSNRRLIQNSIYCGIQRTGNTIVFTPTHNGGTKGDKKGHQFKPNSIELSDSASIGELGSALLECIALCTSTYNT
jgi:hypothetical protein